MSSQTSRRSRRARTAVLSTAAAVLLSIIPFSASAPSAEATLATGGTGRYRDQIDWFDWGAANSFIAPNTTKTFTRRMGTATVETTCTIGQITSDRGQPAATSVITYTPDRGVWTRWTTCTTWAARAPATTSSPA